MVRWEHRRRIKTESKAKFIAAVWGTEFIKVLTPLDIFHQDDFEENVGKNKGYLTEWMLWKNGCLSGSHHNKPSPYTKMDVLPKTFVQIILAANWLVRHSITSPKQQRRPSLLSLSFLTGWEVLHVGVYTSIAGLLQYFLYYFCRVSWREVNRLRVCVRTILRIQVFLVLYIRS